MIKFLGDDEEIQFRDNCTRVCCVFKYYIQRYNYLFEVIIEANVPNDTVAALRSHFCQSERCLPRGLGADELLTYGLKLIEERKADIFRTFKGRKTNDKHFLDDNAVSFLRLAIYATYLEEVVEAMRQPLNA